MTPDQTVILGCLNFMFMDAGLVLVKRAYNHISVVLSHSCSLVVSVVDFVRLSSK